MTFGVNFYAGGPETVAFLQARANRCRLNDVQAQNLSDGDLYLMIFDSKKSLPDGSTPKYSYKYAKDLLLAATFPTTLPSFSGRVFENGVWIAWSTTTGTLTQTTPSGTIYVNGMDMV